MRIPGLGPQPMRSISIISIMRMTEVKKCLAPLTNITITVIAGHGPISAMMKYRKGLTVKERKRKLMTRKIGNILISKINLVC